MTAGMSCSKTRALVAITPREQQRRTSQVGHTFSAGRGIDPASLGIPEDLNEWHVVKTTQRGE